MSYILDALKKLEREKAFEETESIKEVLLIEEGPEKPAGFFFRHRFPFFLALGVFILGLVLGIGLSLKDKKEAPPYSKKTKEQRESNALFSSASDLVPRL